MHAAYSGTDRNIYKAELYVNIFNLDYQISVTIEPIKFLIDLDYLNFKYITKYLKKFG